MNWRIGCSGFYYREWKDVFYQKGLAQKDWFKFYCEHFNTIEINSTFYKMPTQKSFEKWYTESPADFVFTIKAPRLITHYKQLKDCKELLADFYLAGVNGLTDKLACVLFQFPPRFDYTAKRLQLLIDLLDPTVKNVVEFRHASWWDEEIFSRLSEHQIIFCGQSYPSALSDKVVKNNTTLYYRFHGKPILYKSEYSEEVIKDLIRQIPKETEEAFIYFNNTWGTGALTNAKQLQAFTKE